MVAGSECCGSLSAVLLFFGLTLAFVGTGSGQGRACYFPKEWHGSWFQEGHLRPVEINSTAITTKGQCLLQADDKFILHDSALSCYRCLVMQRRHDSVLQYKESYCDYNSNLQHLCYNLITGDAPLKTMIRRHSPPTRCPFHGPLAFSYSRGSGTCSQPPSRIDSCTDDSRLLFRFQACVDVKNSESSEEELECVGEWKDGSARYLVGRLHRPMATTEEDLYRCFIFEKTSTGYLLAQSPDASCSGVISSTEGARTMTLTRTTYTEGGGKCKFPEWIVDHHKWRSVGGEVLYRFHQGNSSVRITNFTRDGSEDPEHGERVLCVSEQEVGASRAVIIAHTVRGCRSGYICMLFHRRDPHVIQVQIGNHSPNKEYACTPMFFEEDPRQEITLVGGGSRARGCPMVGRYHVTGMSREGRVVRDTCQGQAALTALNVGCGREEILELRTECNPQPPQVSAYSCHGQWERNETQYVVVAPEEGGGTVVHFCLVLRRGPKSTLLSSLASSCLHDPVSSRIAFNASIVGQCAAMTMDSGAWRSGLSLWTMWTFSLSLSLLRLHPCFHVS